MSGRGCGAIFRKDKATTAGLCSACGLPDATHLAVILWRCELPALFREGEPMGSPRFLFRGRLILELGIWRDFGGARLDLAWRTYSGDRLGRLEAIEHVDLDHWQERAWVKGNLGVRIHLWERDAREKFGSPLTFADLDVEALVDAVLAGVKAVRREREIADAEHERRAST